MRLYKNSEGVWAGTQADARKMCGKDYQTVDVPTDKPSLLRFLNANKVGTSYTSNGKEFEPVYAPDTDLDKKALSTSSGAMTSYAVESLLMALSLSGKHCCIKRHTTYMRRHHD